MPRLAVLALLCLAVLAFAGGASARTDEQAFQKARACLVSHGATQVRVQTVPDNFHRGSFSRGYLTVGEQTGDWMYEPHYVVGGVHPQVTGFDVTFRHGWTGKERAMLIGCVKQSIGPAGHLEMVTEIG